MPKIEWKPPTDQKLEAMEATAREWIDLGNEAPEGICGSRDVLWLLGELKRVKGEVDRLRSGLVAINRVVEDLNPF